MVELAKGGGCNISREGKGNKQESALSDGQLAYLYQLSPSQQRLLALGEQLFKCHIKQTYGCDEGLVAQIM